MSGRTLILLVAALVAGAVTFIVGRQLGHTLLFLPLFLFWSWGDRRSRVDDDAETEHRLLETGDALADDVDQEDEGHQYAARANESEAA